MMLVLSRRLDESIVLPNCNASVTILSITAGRVRLGIRAPRHVEIHRQEVWERIQRETSLAVATKPNQLVPVLPK